MTAQYKLLQPHFIGPSYYGPGTVVTEGLEIPSGWVPTLCVDPLTLDAVNTFYAAGPRDGGQYEDLNLFQSQNYSATGQATQIKPTTYWKQIGSPISFWVLTGLGTNLPPIPIGGPMPGIKILMTEDGRPITTEDGREILA